MPSPPDAVVLDVAALRLGSVTLPDEGDVVVLDPIGGPIGVALAEELGTRAVLVTQDHIAGNELARSGDLAPANVRLARAGVRIERRTIPREVRADGVVVEDRFTGERRTIPCAAVVDCGFRLPDDPSRRPRCKQAIVLRRGPSTRRSSKAAAPPSRSTENRF